jgi:hypothetical protein
LSLTTATQERGQHTRYIGSAFGIRPTSRKLNNIIFNSSPSKRFRKPPLPNTRPGRRGQQISLATPIYPKTGSFHPHPTTSTTSRHLANIMLRHHSSLAVLLGPRPSQRIRCFTHFQPRHGLRRGHIQHSKIIQILVRRLFSPGKRAPKLTLIR